MNAPELEIVADACRLAKGWIAFTRRLDGGLVWEGNSYHPTKREALTEAFAQLKRTGAAK